MMWILLLAVVGSAAASGPVYRRICRWLDSADTSTEIERVVITLRDGREIVHVLKRPEARS